jgi:hypothetical protein
VGFGSWIRYGFSVGFGLGIKYRKKFICYVKDGNPHQVLVPPSDSGLEQNLPSRRRMGTGMGRFSPDRGGSRESFPAKKFPSYIGVRGPHKKCNDLSKITIESSSAMLR